MAPPIDHCTLSSKFLENQMHSFKKHVLDVLNFIHYFMYCGYGNEKDEEIFYPQIAYSHRRNTF